MLQVFLSTPFHTGLFLLVQSLPPETLHTMAEASLHQGVVHLQAVTQTTAQIRCIAAKTTNLITL
jgi:hypothetical protein